MWSDVGRGYDDADYMSASQREILERVKAATVVIVAWDEGNQRHPFEIIGSGFCVDAAGLVLTCRHVMDAFMAVPALEQIKAATGEKLPDGAEVLQPVAFVAPFAAFYWRVSDTKLGVYLAAVEGAISKTDYDLAVLKVPQSPDVYPGGYPSLEVEEPEQVHEGDVVGACGFPLGTGLRDQLGTVTSSFTRGIVSTIIPGPGVPRHLIQGFQLDIGATHGNSGGPVFLWETGRVFGVIEAGLEHLRKAAPVYPLVDDTETLEQMKRGDRQAPSSP